MFRSISIRCLMVALVLTFAASSMWAQNDAQKASSKTTTQKPTIKKFRGRLPNYYGQIGLLPQQKEAIYAIQRKYHTEIEELKQRLKALEEQEDKEIYEVLDDEQKQALKALQDKRKKKRSSKSKTAGS